LLEIQTSRGNFPGDNFQPPRHHMLQEYLLDFWNSPRPEDSSNRHIELSFAGASHVV
jgi:hypothetical protein